MLTTHLPQHIDLMSQRVIEALAAVTEVDGGLPRLQVEKEHANRAAHPANPAMAKNFRQTGVVHGIAEGTPLGSASKPLESWIAPTRMSGSQAFIGEMPEKT
jgi:hypothetical protein